MISRYGNKNIFAAHYEWFALAVGVIALIAGAVVYFTAMGADPEEAAQAELSRIERMQPSETGVKPVAMEDYNAAVRATRSPVTLAEVSEVSESFLASERRVLCKKCHKAIVGDVKVCPACPFCGEKQEEEAKVVLDADGDGLPDEWERRFGFNPNDAADANADADGDGFTNAEEFAAKTDPLNRKDHPDYVDSLKLVLPLKETYMPFVFIAANKIPTGWRCEFFDANQKDDYGRKGRTLTAVIGDEVGKSGYVLKAYEKKEEKRAIKGGQGMKKTVDISEATLERKADGKVIKIVIAANKKEKPAAVDTQATLMYERGTVKNFDVVKGTEIDLNGVKFRVADIQAAGKGAKVALENSLTGKKYMLEALEQ